MTTDFDPRDLTEDSFANWRRHPATKAFMAYLADYAAALERDHLQRWKQGVIEPDTEAEARGRVATVTEIIDLRYQSIEDFYSEPNEDSDIDAGQDTD